VLDWEWIFIVFSEKIQDANDEAHDLFAASRRYQARAEHHIEQAGVIMNLIRIFDLESLVKQIEECRPKRVVRNDVDRDYET
jgi:mevalonate pyrophosphate decarboxylase